MGYDKCMVMIDDYHHMAWGVAQPHTPCAHGWQAPLHQVTERRAPERTRPPGGWDGTTKTGEAMRDADGPLEPGSLRTHTLAFSNTTNN